MKPVIGVFIRGVIRPFCTYSIAQHIDHDMLTRSNEFIWLLADAVIDTVEVRNIALPRNQS